MHAGFGNRFVAALTIQLLNCFLIKFAQYVANTPPGV